MQRVALIGLGTMGPGIAARLTEGAGKLVVVRRILEGRG
jgi:3-hydroxyisobutyrate dehydrogenase-like beta-hydroxyacid dehydrogenase